MGVQSIDGQALQRAALARVPITRQKAAEIHRLTIGDNSPLSVMLRMVCESHERLRLELDGSAELHKESAETFRKAAGEIGEYRDGLLRIFARCENWSTPDIRANVADLLGLSVAECERLAFDPDGGECPDCCGDGGSWTRSIGPDGNQMWGTCVTCDGHGTVKPDPDGTADLDDAPGGEA